MSRPSIRHFAVLLFALALVGCQDNITSPSSDNRLPATAAAPTASAGHCDAIVSSGSSIQSAINNATSGDIICVDAGTFNEQLTIGKSLTLDGAGPSSSGTVVEGTGSGSGLEVTTSDVTVKGVRFAGFADGIELGSTMSDLTFENVYSVENTVRGMTIGGGADITGLTLEGISFSNNDGDGIRASTASKVDGLTIRDSHFNNNGGDPASSGIEVYQNESSPGYLTNVLVENTTFNNNSEKGLYLEKLSNATFDNITVKNSGTNPNYGFNNGIDINLKYADYEDITIKNSTITNSGLDSDNAPNALFPVAIAIKARDDGSYSATPASLDGVTLTNVTVTNNVSGIRLGEPGKGNAGPTNVVISTSNIFANSRYGVINETLSQVTATCNWWGHATGPQHDDNPKNNPKGDAVTDGVNFIEWSVRKIGRGTNPGNSCVGGRGGGNGGGPGGEPGI